MFGSEKAMAPHSSTLAWKIPWMEEPGRLQTMGLQRVGHDWATSLSLSCIGEGNGNPLQCSCLENPRDRGTWWAAISGVTQSRTWLKRLSSSSSSSSSSVWLSVVHLKHIAGRWHCSELLIITLYQLSHRGNPWLLQMHSNTSIIVSIVPIIL